MKPSQAARLMTAVLPALFVSCSERPPATRAAAHLQAAGELARAGKVERALAEAEHALRAEPQSVASLCLRGELHLRTKAWSAAADDFEAALRGMTDATPLANRTRTRLARAKALVRLGRTDEASAEFDRARAADPERNDKIYHARYRLIGFLRPCIYCEGKGIYVRRVHYEAVPGGEYTITGRVSSTQTATATIRTPGIPAQEGPETFSACSNCQGKGRVLYGGDDKDD
jgi:tetratricopeptide (TPR) repeat protein